MVHIDSFVLCLIIFFLLSFKTKSANRNMFQSESNQLTTLNSALNELGMLATGTTSRKEYLTEIRTQNYLNMLTMNTRYVSSVSIGFRVRPSAPHVRYKPYQMPQKERHRYVHSISINILFETFGFLF